MEKPFDEGVNDAIFGMDGSKSLGSDGFSMLFLQECWETTKVDIMIVVEEFFERGKMNKAMRSTFIVLVPKKEGARELGDYRPISLISSHYKYF